MTRKIAFGAAPRDLELTISAKTMQTMQMADRDVSVVFAREVEQLLPGTVCVPGKDMDRVVSPFTIGLGDAFIGGMLPEFLTAEQRRQALA